MRVELVIRDGHFCLRLDEDDGWHWYPLRDKDVAHLKQSIENLYQPVVKESA